MEKLFSVPISREIRQSRVFLLVFILFLLIPCTLAAQDPSDLKRKAEQGDTHSQVNLGLLYENGKGLPQDYKEAAKWYLKAAEQGNTQAQNHLGLMYDQGKGVPQDYREAVKWYLKSADQGEANGQELVGLMYDQGKGVSQDYKEAVKWYLKSAEQGNAIAQNSLGTAYRDGKGVPQDYKEAAKWYLKSAEPSIAWNQGYAWGQYNLGIAYRDGKGVPQDYKEAAKWYLKSADQGNAFGQNSLGNAYRDGKGVPQDYKEAVEWYRKAAQQGNVQAQNNLGGMYYHGKGVTQDYNEAIKWSLKSLKTKPLFLISVIFPCIFGMMALFFLVIGLRGVMTKKPFLILARWLLFLILLGFGPGILQAVLLPTSGDGSGILTALRWIIPTMLVVIVIFLAFTMRGYIAFGVTDASFRDGLLAALKKLNLAHEETLALIRLPTIGADLQVAVQSWMGTAQIKMKQRQFRRVLVDIVNNMNEYYQNSAIPKVNLTCCIFYVVMGVFMIVLAGVFLFGFSKIL